MKKILLMFVAIMPALAYGMGQEDEAGEGKEVVRPRMTTGLGRNVPPYYGTPAKKICGWVVPEEPELSRREMLQGLKKPWELTDDDRATLAKVGRVIDALLQEGKEERDEFIKRDMENHRKQRDQQ